MPPADDSVDIEENVWDSEDIVPVAPPPPIDTAEYVKGV